MSQHRVRVWDWTVRVFHWLLVLMIAGMWWTADQGHMIWHKWLGAGLVGLLIYRVVWGLIGPNTARLGSLIPHPKSLVTYLKALRSRPYQRSFGHNPLGGLAVISLLGLIIVQISTGLFAVDVNGLASGWFGHLISFELGRTMADLHEASFDMLLLLIALHVSAITIYALVLRANLIGPMITGSQTRAGDLDDATPVHAPVAKVGLAFVIALLVAATIVWFGR